MALVEKLSQRSLIILGRNLLVVIKILGLRKEQTPVLMKISEKKTNIQTSLNAIKNEQEPLIGCHKPILWLGRVSSEHVGANRATWQLGIGRVLGFLKILNFPIQIYELEVRNSKPKLLPKINPNQRDRRSL